MKTVFNLPDPELLQTQTMRFVIVVAQWHQEITEAMYLSAVETLQKYGADKGRFTRVEVSGSFELPAAARHFIEFPDVDCIICLGCVVQGETRHFDFICQAVATGIMDLNIQYNKPVIFGVLTTDTIEQARERAGGKHGNKGEEAAIAAIYMASLKK